MQTVIQQRVVYPVTALTIIIHLLHGQSYFVILKDSYINIVRVGIKRITDQNVI